MELKIEHVGRSPLGGSDAYRDRVSASVPLSTRVAFSARLTFEVVEFVVAAGTPEARFEARTLVRHTSGTKTATLANAHFNTEEPIDADRDHKPQRGSEVERYLHAAMRRNVPGEVHYSAYRTLWEDYCARADEGRLLMDGAAQHAAGVR